MGCDIHMTVERFRNGVWERIESLPPRTCSWCDGYGHYENRPNDTCFSCKGLKVETYPYDNRNYTVFAVLADVRNNGYITPICKPRGLPADVVCGHSDENDNCIHGDHSRSWLTLRELQSYNWKQSIRDEGYVNANVFAEWDKAGGGQPASWCKNVGGGGVEHVTHSCMREYIANGFSNGLKFFEQLNPDIFKRNYYTLVQWTVPLTDYCSHFLSFVETLALLGSPDDVRIVFGFDS